jgi:hypothetical protein
MHFSKDVANAALPGFALEAERFAQLNRSNHTAINEDETDRKAIRTRLLLEKTTQ